MGRRDWHIPNDAARWLAADVYTYARMLQAADAQSGSHIVAGRGVGPARAQTGVPRRCGLPPCMADFVLAVVGPADAAWWVDVRGTRRGEWWPRSGDRRLATAI